MNTFNITNARLKYGAWQVFNFVRFTENEIITSSEQYDIIMRFYSQCLN